MALYKCTKCPHEWETYSQKDMCDWCGNKGKQIGNTWGDKITKGDNDES